MKCPLMIMARHSSERSGFPPDYYCLQEECAWWDSENGECDFKVLRRNLGLIALALSEIANKMPHELQFRK